MIWTSIEHSAALLDIGAERAYTVGNRCCAYVLLTPSEVETNDGALPQLQKAKNPLSSSLCF
jgi:hypothetical protein